MTHQFGAPTCEHGDWNSCVICRPNLKTQDTNKECKQCADIVRVGSFDEKCPHTNQTGWEAELEHLIGNHEEVRLFITSLITRIKSEERADVIGKIGAMLLARHSPQIVLDAYFDAANEELEEEKTL